MDKVISSPLTYWGGKRWLFKTVHDLIPEGETEIFSPFLGGGSIEINLAYRGYTIHAYDNYAPLVNFWQHWLDDPEAVRLAAYEMLGLYSRDALNRLRKNPSRLSYIESVAIYLIHNRLTYSGGIQSNILPYGLHANGEYIKNPSPKSFGLNRVFSNWDFWKSKPCSNLNINKGDFEQVFWIHNHQFAYIDPPYFGNEKLYGGSRENGFDHELLRELVDGRKKTVISYNDHPKAYELYDGFYIKRVQRSKLTSDGRQELLILSPDIAERFEPKQLTLF